MLVGWDADSQAERADDFPTAARHSAQSWHERYKKNQNPFTRRVERFIQADIDNALWTGGEREKKAQREAERRARVGDDRRANGEDGGEGDVTGADAEGRAEGRAECGADAEATAGAAPAPAPAPMSVPAPASPPMPPQAPTSSPLAVGRKRKLAVSDSDSGDPDEAPTVKRRAKDKGKDHAESARSRTAIGPSARVRPQDPAPRVAAINFPGRAPSGSPGAGAAGDTATDDAVNKGAAATEPAEKGGVPVTEATEDQPAAVLSPAEASASRAEVPAAVEVQVQVEMISVEVSGPEEALGSIFETVREDLGLGDNAPVALGANDIVAAAASLADSAGTDAAAASGAATDAATATDSAKTDTPIEPPATPRVQDSTPASATFAALASQTVSPPRTPPLTLKHLPGSPVISVRAPALPTPARGRVSLPAVDADGQPYDRGHNTAPSRVAGEIAAQRRRRSSLSTPNAGERRRVSTSASASARRRRPSGVDTVTSSTAPPPPYQVPPRPATPATATPPPARARPTSPPRPLTPKQHEERVRAGAQIVYSVRDQYRARIQRFSEKYAATPSEIFAIVNHLPRAHATGGDAYWDDVEGGLRAHFGF